MLLLILQVAGAVVVRVVEEGASGESSERKSKRECVSSGITEGVARSCSLQGV